MGRVPVRLAGCPAPCSRSRLARVVGQSAVPDSEWASSMWERKILYLYNRAPLRGMSLDGPEAKCRLAPVDVPGLGRCIRLAVRLIVSLYTSSTTEWEAPACATTC